MQLAGRILSPLGFVSGSLEVKDGRVTALKEGPAGARLLLPGFVDLHVHGGAGADVMDGAEGIAQVAAFHLQHGTTSLCPTTVTRPLHELQAVLRALAVMPDAPDRARLLGAHLEGPFLARARRGAQPDHCLPPDLDQLQDLLAAGPVAVMTLAPELVGALELIPELCSRGIRTSLGHSEADYEAGRCAFAAGAGGVTHLFNAMRGLHHRQPGLAAAALEAEGAYLEVILDGHHVHPALFQLARRTVRGRLILVSDAIRAAGQPPGKSELGGQEVTVAGGRATLADGTLAGSVLTLDQALLNAVELGVPLEEASNCLSLHPADALGRTDLGRLSRDAWADIVELDGDDLTLRRVFRAGVEVPLSSS